MVSRAPCPQAEPDGYVEYISRYGMPIAPQVAAAAGLARAWFKPRFVGLENLPEQPALFIGNHAFMAIDAALFQPHDSATNDNTNFGVVDSHHFRAR